MATDNNWFDDLDVDLGEPPPNANAAAQTSAAALAGEFFGPYELLYPIGEGGVAVVHRARHIHPQYVERPLALKLLRERLSDDERIKLMFRREASVLSLIKHRNVVETFEAGVHQGTLYLAMEYVEGKDLENLLWRSAHAKLPIPLEVKLFVLCEVLRALAYAHNLRDLTDQPLDLVHRDVNPANVFLSFDGHTKLGDFGVTSLRAGSVQRSREVAGKVGYFAPEQLKNESIDARVDIYAVGSMLFEVICGQKLFKATDSRETMRLNLEAEIPDIRALAPNCPSELVELTVRALARDPKMRPQSAASFLAELLPFVPERALMQLKLRALMRTLFAQEHQQALELAKKVHLRGHRRDDISTIELVCADPVMNETVANYLVKQGYEVVRRAALSEVLAGLDEPPPSVVLWAPDVPFDPANLRLRRRFGGEGPVPLVVLGKQLDELTSNLAVRIGARDVLFRPMTPERLLNALMAVPLEEPDKSLESSAPSSWTPKPRTLICCDEEHLGQALGTVIASQGHVAFRVSTASEAMAALGRRTFEQFVLVGGSAGEFSHLLGELRGSVGVGTVPALWVTPAGYTPPAPVPLPLRCAQVALPLALPSIAELGPLLRRAQTQLAQQVQAGHARLFVRFGAELPLEVRFGGREFTAVAANLSRGGLLLKTLQLPSIGTPLGLRLKLPFGEEIHAQGVALRVMISHTHVMELVQVGVAFSGFVADGEARYIAYLTHLAAQETTKP